MLAVDNGNLPIVKPAGWLLYSPSRKAIVVAAKDNVSSIQELIQDILNQGSVAIVVDDNSNDGTPLAAEAAGAWVVRSDQDIPFTTAIRQAIHLAASLGDEILVIRG